MSKPREVTLGEIAEFQEGYVNPPQSKSEYFDGPIKWLRAVDLNNSFVFETSRSLTENGYRSAGKSAYLFPPNTLAISKSGTIGRLGIIKDWMCGNRAVINIRPRNDLADTRYVFYALLSDPAQIDVLAEGSVQRNLYVSQLSTFKMPLPELSKQRQIAELLGALDEKIDLNRRMNETLEAMARAIFRGWFVDFGPTRAKAEGRAPYLAPEIWNLFPDTLDDEDKPVGWTQGTLADVAGSPRRGVSPADVAEDTPYIGLEHMPRRSIALSEWEGAGKVTSNKSVFKKGEFLFGKLRPYFHKVGFAPLDGICSTDIVVVIPRSPEWAAFTLACLSSDEFVDYTNQTSTGTKMPRTSWKTMGQYKVCLPPDQIARAFQSVVQPLLDRIGANTHEVHTLARTRDLLLPKLMSGEIRIGEAEKAVEAVA
ncbi:restriction endonuclease subunit S [Magnetospira thiophila]